jgi:hypothetical protein
MVAASEGPQPTEPGRGQEPRDQQSQAQLTAASPAEAGRQRADGRGTGPDTADRGETPLVPGEQAESYRSRWEAIQTGFVDEPRRSVEQADHLVAEVIKRVAEVFAEERSTLEGQWSRGDQVDTEQLRVALKRYRTFFERLLSA